MSAIDPEDLTLVADPPSGAVTTLIDVPPAELQVLANRYELVALLGVGGMGAVYRARDRELADFVALKMLRRELVNVPDMLARFRQEVKLARKVTSPNVARTFDIGEHDGDRFLTMELVEGESLAGLVARERRLPPRRALALAIPIASGLAAAHDVGVVHRDLKPENVLLGRDGSVKVTDFGIATAHADVAAVRVTQGAIGTPAYMAPEQVTAEPTIDARADVYAFGVMLYEMLTGAMPWNGETVLAVASARLVKPPPDPRVLRPEIDRPLAELVLSCMAREPRARPANGAAIVSVLRALDPGAHVDPRVSAHPAPISIHDGGHRTVALLPIANEGPPEDDYVANGITDELIDGLSMSPSLRVQGRGAVIRYRNDTRDPRAIGRELGVQVVVTGALQRTDDRVRVTLRMTSVADGFQIWSRRFERAYSKVLEIAGDATAAIATAVTVDPDATRRSALIDPETLDLYLRARHEYHTYGPDHLKRATVLFQQALARSPDDALVLAGHATALARQLSFATPSATAFREAATAAERAAELAPQLSESNVALATLRRHEFRRVDAARFARRALEIAPSSAEARLVVGRMLLETGLTAPGLAHLRVALEVDRGLALAWLDMIRTHALLGDWSHARELMLANREGERPWAFWMTMIRMFGIWRRDEAFPEIRRRLLESVHASDPELARYLAVVEHGDPEPVHEVFERILGAGTNTPWNRAFGHQLSTEIYAAAGKIDAAIAHLTTAVTLGFEDLLWTDRCPVLDPLRADPRFAPLRALVAERAAEIARVLG
jgi:serine/threonine-protein kinase